MKELNTVINQKDLVDIYRAFHSTIAEYSFFFQVYTETIPRYHIMAIKQTSASLKELKL